MSSGTDDEPSGSGSGAGRAPEVPNRRGGVPTPRLHVLLVEDSDDNREMLQILLELEGFRVDVAADGGAGVRQAVALRPDVAVVDIGLPVIDGYEVARQVRAALGGSVRLIALTGYGRPEDHARATAAGFDAHVTKPVDPAVLTAVLHGSAG